MMIKDTPSPEHHDITSYRLEMIERTLESLAENIKQLTTLEQKHLETRESLNRSFKAIAAIEERTRAIELEMPTLKMVRGWVLAGMVGILGLLGIAIFKLFSISVAVVG
jgi:hypothetical protein